MFYKSTLELFIWHDPEGFKIKSSLMDQKKTGDIFLKSEFVNLHFTRHLTLCIIQLVMNLSLKRLDRVSIVLQGK